MKTRSFATLVAVALAAASASVGAIQIENFNGGSFAPRSSFAPGSSCGTSIETGNLQAVAVSNAFVAFDLSNVPVAFSASIEFAGGNGSLGVASDQPFALELRVFGGDVGSLLFACNTDTPVEEDYFGELGGGTQVGSATLPNSTGQLIPMPAFSVDLSSDFVAQFNALRTSAEPVIVLGLSAPSAAGIAWVGSTRESAARLLINPPSLPVPVSEPAPIALLALWAGLLVVARRRTAV